jgi:hypothetical protein
MGWGDGETTGELTVKGARHLGRREKVFLRNNSFEETSLDLPLQEDQVSPCEDGGPEGALRDEVARDDIQSRAL